MGLVFQSCKKLYSDSSKEENPDWSHVLRMEDSRIPKNIVPYSPDRQWNIGRPQLRWRDQLVFKRMEQTKHGLLQEDDDDDDGGEDDLP
jgi:hypothetical protein